jgi:hypothetical protein
MKKADVRKPIGKNSWKNNPNFRKKKKVI